MLPYKAVGLAVLKLHKNNQAKPTKLHYFLPSVAGAKLGIGRSQ